MRNKPTQTHYKMKFKKTILLLSLFLLSAYAATAQGKPSQKGYVVITDYIKNDGKKDVSDAIQNVIDRNPNRTVFFPDGTYMISKPILTPADPKKSVALVLSNYAIIRAVPEWKHEEAMIRLGGKDPYNDIRIPGSNYYLEGGIIDGNKVANGVSIDGGRETAVRNTSIKNTIIGLHVKHGANSGSSDCDINNVNIVGTFTPQSIGVLVEGFDNTFTNMRIGGVHIGFKIRSEANCLRNIHPLYYGSDKEYETSCGFLDERQCNWYDFCYSDEFATAFRNNGGRSTYNNCFAYWYSKRGKKHVVFRSDGQFNSSVINMTAGIRAHNATTENKVLEAKDAGGNGIFYNLDVNGPQFLTDTSHERYMTR